MTTPAEILEFALRRTDSADQPLSYLLSIAIDREVVWPVSGEASISLEVQIDDLLAYLTEFWKPLMLRQVYPIPVSPLPLRPSDFRRLAEQRWSDFQPSLVEHENSIVSAFEEAHDLSLAFGGQYGLPHFWMMRSTEHMIVETAGRLWELPLKIVEKTFERIGDQICQILSGVDVVRWDAALDAWALRNKSDAVSLLAWSIGTDKDAARELLANGELKAPKDFNDAVNDNDELRIAARMAGALPPEQVRTVLSVARRFQKHRADQLKSLAEQCRRYIYDSFGRKRPFEQGEAAALFVRDKLKIASYGRADVAGIAKSLGIEVNIASVAPSSFDGLAIWGNMYGPGVFLNQASSRVDKEQWMPVDQENKSIRVTLAHEMCHLLVDGDHALSAVEVLNARMPAGTEARAKAFAGEFLLPTQASARAWQLAGHPVDDEALRNLLGELVEQFGVTWSVASWKLQHGAAGHNVDLHRVLSALAPDR